MTSTVGSRSRTLALARRGRVVRRSACPAGIRRCMRASRRDSCASRRQAPALLVGAAAMGGRRSHGRTISASRRRVEVASECGLRVAGPEGVHRYAIYGRAARFVAQGALAQAVQEHREWVKFDNMTQEHGPALQRVFFVLFLISLPSFQPWIPEPEFALLAAESELGLSWGASCGILQILQLEYHNSSRSLT